MDRNAIDGLRALLENAMAQKERSATDAVAFVALKMVIESAKRAYELTLEMDHSLPSYDAVKEVLRLSTLEQTKKLALFAFQAGFGGEDSWAGFDNLDPDFLSIPSAYQAEGEEEDEDLKAWWRDQDKIGDHYFELGQKLRLRLNQPTDTEE